MARLILMMICIRPQLFIRTHFNYYTCHKNLPQNMTFERPILRVYKSLITQSKNDTTQKKFRGKLFKKRPRSMPRSFNFKNFIKLQKIN